MLKWLILNDEGIYNMKKIILLSALAFIFTACGETSGDADYRGDTTVNTTTIDSGGGDVTINDVEVDGNGTYIYNEDGTVTYSTGDGFTNTSGADAIVEASDGFDEGYDQAECTAAGYFYCTLNNICVNQPADAGTCTSAATMMIYTY